MWILSGIQFTRHFIGFVLVEMNQLLGSNPNVSICGKYAVRARVRLRQANAERQHFICPCEFAICFDPSECRGKSDLGTRNFGTCKNKAAAQWRHQMKNRIQSQNLSEVATAQRHYFASPEVVHRPRSDHPLHFLILGTYSKSVWQNKMLALGVCFPQPCSSAGRMFAASRPRLDYLRPIGSLPQEQIRCSAL